MRNLISHLLDKAMDSTIFTAILAVVNLILLVKLAIEVGFQRQYEWTPLLLAKAINTWYSADKFLENSSLSFDFFSFSSFNVEADKLAYFSISIHLPFSYARWFQVTFYKNTSHLGITGLDFPH